MKAKNNSIQGLLSGGGQMGELIRSFDWSKTSLGTPDSWPQSLRIAVRIMLDSPFGMYIAWSNEYIQLYNDGYRPILGATKHPEALGTSTSKTFKEIWSTIGPMFEDVMRGIPVGFPDFILHLDRNGFVEECVFDFSYSPIRLEDGTVGGVLVTVVETTEKVKNFKKLTETNDQLNFAIEAAELGAWDVNPVTYRFTGNNRFKDWFGLPHDVEIDLSSAIEAIIEEDRSRVTQAIEKALQYESGGLYDIDYSIINAVTKQQRFVRAKGRAWFGDDKKAYRFNGTLQDITEETISRKKIEDSEKRLAKERKVLYNSFMNAPAAICIYRGETHVYEFANVQYEKLAGRKITIGKTFKELFPEMEEQGLIDMLDAVFTTGEPFISNELPIVVKNIITGELVLGYYNVVVDPLKDDNGNIERLLSHTVEVTQQVEARKQIEASEMRFGAAIEAVEGILWTNNANGEMEGEQQGWAALTGQTYEEYKGYGWAAAVHPDDAQPTIDAWNEAVKESKTFVFEHRVKMKTGEWGVFSIKAIPLFNEDGSIREWIGVHTNITERKQKEETFRYSKALLEAHNEANRDGLLLVDAKGKIISYNQSFIDVWRMPKEILKTKDDELALQFAMSQLVNPKQFIDKVKWLYENPVETSTDELEYLDGRIIERHGYSVIGEDGTYYAWSWTFRDITEQKATAAAIIESEVKFRTLSETIPHMIWTAGPDGKRNFFNQFTLDYTGKTVDELYGDGWQKIISPLDLERTVKQWHQSIQTGEDFKIENRWLRRDGTYRWFLARGIAQKDNQGKIIGWIGTNTDIQDQKRFAEELETKVHEHTIELTEKEDYLNRIITNAPDAVIVIDEESSITLWNPKTEEVFGWKAEEVLGLNLTDIIVPTQYREAHREGMKRFLKTGVAHVLNKTLELTALNKNGKEFDISLTISQATQHGSNLFIAFLRDITLEKQTKAELIIKSNQLEEMNYSLETKNMELEKTNEELASFSYVASHDLQEPLRKIQTFGRLIVETENLSGRTLDYFNRMISAGERMQNLIISLLSFSSTATTNLVFIACDLNTIVEESKEDLQLIIVEKQAVIEYENLPTINASQVQLGQLFTNLIENAIKYSRPGIIPHIKITASIVEGKKIEHPSSNNHKNYHAIKIADNGIGFEKEYANKIFELFQRLHHKTEYTGTGIGLAIVKKVVTNHNGFILVEGKPNVGSTFTIYIPTA